MKRILGVLLVGKLFMFGCVTMHAPEMAVQTVTTEKNIPQGCIAMGRLDSFSMWGREPAMVYLRNMAVEKGATHVVLKEQKHSFWGMGYGGDAYACL